MGEPGAKKAFLLRIDPALWSELEAWAAAELRSVNGQMEWILRRAVEKRIGDRKQLGAPTQDPPEN